VLHLEEKKGREPFRKEKEDVREQLSSSSRHTHEKKQLESQLADKNRIIHQYQ
jgi:hypothetical protein